jgi:hypothetical protein
LTGIRNHLTYANVVSTLCLFVLLGGGAYAAVKLPKNSVTSKQVKNGSIKEADLANHGITAKSVKPGSLLASDFAAGQLPGSGASSQTVLFAEVASDWTTVVHTNVPGLTATSSGVGSYIDFHRDVTNCTPLAALTSGGSANQAEVDASKRGPSFPTQIRVDDWPNSGNFNSGLAVALFC